MGENERPDNPVANVVHKGQQNVTGYETLMQLMRGAELSLIGRSDLLGVKTGTSFRRLVDQSSARQLAVNNNRRLVSADASRSLTMDDRPTAVNDLSATMYGLSPSVMQKLSPAWAVNKLWSPTGAAPAGAAVNKAPPSTGATANIKAPSPGVVNKLPAAVAAGAAGAAAAAATETTQSDDLLDIDKTYTGLLDLKVAIAQTDGFVAASGPPFTYDGGMDVEPFRWSDSPIRHLPHYGQPDAWPFTLVASEWFWN